MDSSLPVFVSQMHLPYSSQLQIPPEPPYLARVFLPRKHTFLHRKRLALSHQSLELFTRDQRRLREFAAQATPDISSVIVILPITQRTNIILKALAAGKIGEVTFSPHTVNFMNKESKWFKTPWRTVPDYQGGFLLDDTLHVILPIAMTYLSSSHSIYELSFAAPSPSRSDAGRGLAAITGTDGWLQVQQTMACDLIHNVENGFKSGTRDANGVLGPKKEEVIDEPMRGVELEQVSFFAAIDEN
ncbi:uncharacterized protein F5147DRAFT_816255 [Suillus discolor]|uniref:Uncharacterized protein n=1 Tax=Suillus discolor TaxID=1912936 RepID=A0A9P7JQ90_9AGAM|nr:uncharacterized protein F5147DRAFT_816243 [Suillus discolor]XP_041288743.1 uncharacterized protein F5147DRAFT_816255 [Suillus discolor]KAG2097973.1 hypothetical protein F5147DRAFT_816243 [Suillus discolor]KAG2097985.1 hypothetical protein F5147DRAFT_816255 [Suillus discolor]